MNSKFVVDEMIVDVLLEWQRCWQRWWWRWLWWEC